MKEPRPTPFDFETALASGTAWQDDFAWPVTPTETAPVLAAQLDRVIAFVRQLSDEKAQATALLCLPRVLFRVRALTEASLAIQAEAPRGLRLVGGPPELDWLRAGGDQPPVSATTEQLAFVMDARLKNAPVRRFLRTASWTPFSKLPGTLLRPAITAISHSELVRKSAQRNNGGIGFFHSHSLLEDAHQRYGQRSPDWSTESLVAAMTDALSDIEELSVEIRSRLHLLIRAEVAMRVDIAAGDLGALAAFPKLPYTVWSGSGGQHAARAVGLEVLRRDGAVVRFDHSGSTGLSLPHAFFAIVEFSVSSRFVMATSQATEIAKQENMTATSPSPRPLELTHSDGFPSYGLAARVGPVPGGARPRVIYAPTMLSGFQTHTPALPQDLVYLDLQINLAKMLAKMPLDLLCKPHLEGLFRDRTHPLAQFAPTADSTFEEHMKEADVFVFDYTRSTTNWKALCTDRRIVLVDLGLYPYSDSVKTEIEKRCRIVRAHFDERGRAVVPPEELEEAVLGSAPPPDPTWFRRQFLEPEYVN